MLVLSKMFSKKATLREYRIQKKIHGLVPRSVPRVIGYSQGKLHMKVIRGKTLFDAIQTMSDAVLMKVIGSVMRIMFRIRKKFPDFRHNDLHLKNIMIQRISQPVIIDFELAGSRVRNKLYGLTRNTKPYYDTHFFLNSVYTQVFKRRKMFPKTYSWLLRVLPPGFRGGNTRFVNNYRLRV